MEVTNRQIIDYLLANPGMSDAQIVSAMEQFKISPAQMAAAVGLDEGVVASRVAATVPPGNSVTLGDTVIVPQYQYSQSGEDNQVGPLETFYTSKTNGDPNYKAPVGTPVQIYSPTGEFINTVETKKDLSFFGGIADALKDPVVQAALLGVAGGAGVFDTLFSGTPTALATEGLTLSELGLGGSELGAVTNVADVVAGTQGGLLTGGAEAATGLSLAELGGTAGAGALTAAESAALYGTGAAAVAPAVVAPPASTGLLSSALPAAGTVGGALASGALSTLGGAAATGLLGNAITGGLGLAGGVLQSQESRDAATAAAANVNTATQQAVAGSQFRPVGMTTRFGTSNYTYDPVTGQMTSAGYQLSPEAKAAQDRLVGLAGRGLTQAEQAQQQFAPLQTGAQNLFGLGNQYISQSPQDVAQNYINQQMQLLQPSREMELANLQNRLQQQGRAGLSVAQGGTLGATTPELQALYNARAQQELQLAANAQREGQQNTLFGAGLLGQGSQALGQYFGGQVQAYQPYQAAMGQVQNLESLGQQPLQMGASLGQQSATAGANAGRIGLTGAQISGNLMTSPAVTNNPYAAFLGGLGSPTSTLGQGLANYITGYNPTADQNAVLNPYLTPTSSVWTG
jgi:hypothetical protein